MEAAWAKLDVNGRGCVTLDIFEEKYQAQNHPRVQLGQLTEDEAVDAAVNKLESLCPTVRREGLVRLDDFAKYYAAVGAHIKADAHFLLLVDSAWK